MNSDMALIFIIGVICGMSVVILNALLASAYDKRRTGRQATTAPESGGAPATPSPGSLWAVPEAEAQPVHLAASTLDLAEQIHETAKLFNQLREQAYKRGLGVAMKLEQEYDEELSEEQEDEPGGYQLKVFIYQPLRVAELRAAQCCGGAHPHPPPPSAHLSPSAPRRAGQAGQG